MPSGRSTKPARRPARPWRRAGRFLRQRWGRYFPTGDQLWHLPKLLSLRERYLLLGLAIVAVGALAALPISAYYHFTDPLADYGGSFSEGMVGTPKYINPLLAQTSDVDRDLSELVYAGLMRFDQNGALVNGLAQSQEVSADGLTYTFKLKPGLQWHDGQPFTAADVVFTVLTAQNADYGNFQRTNWQGVEVSQGDDQTVIFKLRNKYAQFLANTTLGILPKHLWENVKPASFGLSELNLKPVGAGPYRFNKLRRDPAGNVTHFSLTAFENYHAGRPYIDQINLVFYASEEQLINAFNDNQIDGLSFVSPEKLNAVRWLGKLNLQELKLPRYFAVFFNQNQSIPFSDKNVRVALNQATDKTAILQTVLDGRGKAVDSPLLPGILDLPENGVRYPFDLEQAKVLLESAGWKYNETTKMREKAAPPAKKGQPTGAPAKLELRLTTSNWPELVKVADRLKAQWEAAGASVQVEILALPELQQAIRERSYEALLFGEVLGLDPDPFSFWHSSQKRAPGLNLALYDNREADRLLEEARQTLDTVARGAKYADLQKLIVNDAPVVLLYSPDYLYGLPDKVQAPAAKVIAVPSDRFEQVEKWYIETKRTFKK